MNRFRKKCPLVNEIAKIFRMTFKLSLVLVVYPPSGDEITGLSVALLQKANAWLQRRNSGFEDDLLIVGIGFEDESALTAMLKPYGLSDAQLTLEHLDRDDANELGDSMTRVVSRFCPSEAVSIVNWNELVRNNAYPLDGWWWVGLESLDDEEASAYVDVVRNLVPGPFQGAAMTWTAILAACLGLTIDGEGHEVYESDMNALTLARWLNGFDAATGNNFYNFSAAEVINEIGLDMLRLGFEAGHNHYEDLGCIVYGDGVDDDDLQTALLMACLERRNESLRDALSSAFGGDASLFWSLYTSIWKNFQKPANDVMEDMLAADEGELADPMDFVIKGWIDLE